MTDCQVSYCDSKTLAEYSKGPAHQPNLSKQITKNTEVNKSTAFIYLRELLTYPNFKLLAVLGILMDRRCRRSQRCICKLEFLADRYLSPIYSSKVLTSPSGRPNALAFSKRLMILPLRVFGRLSTKVIVSGLAIGPISCPT